MTAAAAKDFEEYITIFPSSTQEILQQIRTTIKQVVPNVEETISYGIPTFKLNGTYLIYFAAYKKHIGFYPVPGALEEIDEGFAAYKTTGKGTLQFPLDKAIPLDLVAKLVEFKVKENAARAEKKKPFKTGKLH